MASPFVFGAASVLSDWAVFQARRQLRLQAQCFDAAISPSRMPWAPLQRTLGDAVSHALAWPFDLLRIQHALAVQAGLCTRSLLESQRFESGLDVLEKASLGPLARSV